MQDLTVVLGQLLELGAQGLGELAVGGGRQGIRLVPRVALEVSVPTLWGRRRARRCAIRARLARIPISQGRRDRSGSKSPRALDRRDEGVLQQVLGLGADRREARGDQQQVRSQLVVHLGQSPGVTPLGEATEELLGGRTRDEAWIRGLL